MSLALHTTYPRSVSMYGKRAGWLINISRVCKLFSLKDCALEKGPVTLKNPAPSLDGLAETKGGGSRVIGLTLNTLIIKPGR